MGVDENNMWVAVPPAQKVFFIALQNMTMKKSIPILGVRPHGLFMDNGYMWIADTQKCEIHKTNPNNGKILDGIPAS